MKVLVTGGAGFIGSNFVHLMLEKHPEATLVNVDSLTYAGNLENLADVERHPNYSFVKADISDEGAMMKLFEQQRFDAVVNFAAESHVDRSLHIGAHRFIQTNILGTQILLDASRAGDHLGARSLSMSWARTPS